MAARNYYYYATGLLPTALMSAYLLYIFRHFETTVTVHHPLELLAQRRLGAFFRHPVGTAPYGSRICPFGRVAVLALVGFLGVRAGALARGMLSWPVVRRCSAAVLVCTGALSLLNLNAVLYLAPYFAVEGAMLLRAR